MNRRRFLGVAATVAVSSAVGCIGGIVGGGDGRTALGEDYEPLTDYYFGESVVYNYKQLRLRAVDSPVSVGGVIKFRITNTSGSSVTLGCRNPWTIQKRVDGEWHDVVWTSADSYLTCATPLPAGESTIVNVTISEVALETQSREVPLELNPGQYRFVMLSPNPYLAVNFRVHA